MTSDRTLDVPGATIVYDVHGPLPTEDGRPPLMMIGQPMDASGFGALASQFPDRTVVTYDPRGLGRSGGDRDAQLSMVRRPDGKWDADPRRDPIRPRHRSGADHQLLGEGHECLRPGRSRL